MKGAGQSALWKMSQGGTTGPNSGQATGQRDGGTPEETTFQRERVPTRDLGPRGQIVGSLTVDGPSAAGEPTIQKGGAVEQAVRQLSEEVEKEPLPVEYRDQIQRFHSLLLGGGGESSAGSGEK